MTPHAMLDQYLEGAITFAELIAALADYHVNLQNVAAAAHDTCANCGRSLKEKG